MADKKRPFIVRFTCEVQNGVRSTREHELATCLYGAESEKSAIEWGMSLRKCFLNDSPQAEIQIVDENQVGVDAESVEDFMKTLADNTITLVKSSKRHLHN